MRRTQACRPATLTAAAAALLLPPGPRRAPRSLLLLCMALAVLPAPPAAVAQQVRTMLEEVVVSARKRPETALESPLSITAFSGADIDALKVRDLTRLSVGIPNVALDDVGTRRGTANFSIRGLGINSSIPSIDPTVGVFVNGVYLAVNNDTIFDIFDLESIEVLRGPQGILFGRNVTGGAVLLQTRRPGKTFTADARVALEGGGDGGLNRFLMGGAGGPLTDAVQARVSLYLNDDEGYFENRFDGEDFGAIRQEMARATVAWQPDAHSELTVFYEHMDIDGDGPASQSHRNGSGIAGTPENFRRNSFDFAIDGKGYQEVSSDFLTVQFDRDVRLGNGSITNIFGWREQSSVGYSDIDAQPVFLFHAPGWIDAEQWSNELRYAGSFSDRLQLTAGAYVFSGDVAYHDRRLFLGQADGSAQITQDGGGRQSLVTIGVFSSVDYTLSHKWTLNAGLRASWEEKSVEVASFNLNTNAPCNVVIGNSCPFDFTDQAQFNTLAPMLGLSYMADDTRHIYAHWTRGYRSGGYNLRNSNAAEAPGPYDEERVDSFELGIKARGERWQVNAAAFYSRVEDMQREVNLASEGVGILQLIRNTATVDIAGIEVDGTLQIDNHWQLRAAAGYLDASYRSVRFDLNGDGRVDGADKNLDLPRAPELTYSLGALYTLSLGAAGTLAARADYAYRDQVAYTDNNLGYILEQDMLDLAVDFTTHDRRWQLALYGRNLLDSVKHGGDSQLPAQFIGQPLGGTFSPLARGRLLGVDLTYRLGNP